MSNIVRNTYELDTQYKLGLTVASIATFAQLGIPKPDQVVFQKAAVYYAKANFHRTADGYPTLMMTWDILSLRAVNALRYFLQNKISNTVYVYTDARDGATPRPQQGFALYKAIMWESVLAGQEGTPVARSPYAVQSFQAKFMHLELQV